MRLLALGLELDEVLYLAQPHIIRVSSSTLEYFPLKYDKYPNCLV